MGESEKIWGGFISNTVPDIVKSAVTLYEDEHVWLVKQKAGFDLISKLFDYHENQKNLNDKINEALQHKTQWGESDLLHCILSYQANRSNEFLSKWIELKNSALNQKNETNYLDQLDLNEKKE